MIAIRAAGAQDIALYQKLFVELELDEAVPADNEVAPLLARMSIAELDGRAVGFLITSSQGVDGFIRQIVVDPSARRSGVGAALMEHARIELAHQGHSAMRLNVIKSNTTAIALYRTFGFVVDYDSVALWVERDAIMAMPSAALACFEVSEADDEALEQTWSLQAGLLASYRAKGSTAIVAQDAQRVVGLMCWAPAFQGARPFCARSTEAARALLDETARRATAARVGVVLERDLTMLEPLVRHGALVRFHMHQLIAPCTPATTPLRSR